MDCILVPFDGSKPAWRAANHAFELARSRRGTVHLLHVAPELDDYGMVRAYLPRARYRQAAAARAQSLLASVAARFKGGRVPCATHIAWGDPAKAIAKTARRLKCTSIVMGTRGLGALGGVLLGSVATKTISLSKVPVTLVR